MKPKLLDGWNYKYKTRMMGKRYETSVDFIPIENCSNGTMNVIVTNISGLSQKYKEGTIINVDFYKCRNKGRVSRLYNTTQYNKWISFAKLMVM